MNVLWALSEIRTPFFNQVFQFITYLGQELFLIGVICVLYWCVDKRLAAQIGFTYIIAGLCVQGLKITFRIPRPWILDPEFKAVESAVGAATGYSFPSGHTQGGTSLFAPLALHTRKWYLKFLFTAAFLLIGFSRMYLGCHTPKDVLVSMGISLISAWFIWKYQNFFTGDNAVSPASVSSRFTGKIAVLAAAAAILICCYSFTLYHAGIIEECYAADCFKASGAALGFAGGWYLEQKHLRFSLNVSSTGRLVVRFLFGLLVTAAIQFGLKALIGHTLAGKMLQHAIVIFWIIYGYPYLFTHFSKQDKFSKL